MEEVHRQSKLWKESIEMSKTVSGFVLVGGLIVVAVGGLTSAIATSSNVTPDKDWLMDLMNYGGIAVAITGLAMFFFGALRFSKAK
jgi:hypothetical protein